MATFKLRHLILFIIAAIITFLAQFPLGALVLLALWMQIAVLLWELPFTVLTQKKIFFLFLSLAPITLFWGALADFSKIYLQGEQFFKFLIMSLSLLLVNTWCLYFYIYSFRFFSNEKSLLEHYGTGFKLIKNSLKELCLLSVVSLALFVCPLGAISTDYKIVLLVLVTHLYLKRVSLRRSA